MKRARSGTIWVVLLASGCSATVNGNPDAGRGSGTGGAVGAMPGSSGGSGPAPQGGSGGTTTAGRGGGGGGGGRGGSSGNIGSGGAVSSTGGAIGTGGSAGATTLTCSQAVNAFTVSSVPLAATFVPHVLTQGFGASLFAQVPVAVNPGTGAVYVGFTQDTGGGSLSGMIVPADTAATTAAVTIPGVSLAGIAVTNNGFGALVFDPNDNVDARTWAAVRRFDTAGAQTFNTELFHSLNLTDENTKGAPGTSRFAYVPAADQLVAYFGHTEMIQAVRHQGGYLATLNATGVQTVVSGWWGSHNLDQRVLVAGSQIGLLGLGDAFPKGIFFSFLVSRPQTRVLITLAGNGQGNTNGQLGGMVDLDDVVAVPFITNDSISQTLTPGDWPNIDQTIAGQISTAAANGNKLGMLLVPKSGTLPAGDVAPIWLDPMLGTAAGVHIERLKAARYGGGALILLAWAEVTGTTRTATRNYFTMIVDRQGAVCQPKTSLAAANAFTSGDDLVRRPDGAIVWGSITGTRISVVTLTPG